MECEDGNDTDFEDMEVCDLQGWLIPREKSKEFETIWKEETVDDEWVDFFVFANWKIEKDKLTIEFS